jgi:glycosyltransferase involved in cell wall biosynthesis
MSNNLKILQISTQDLGGGAEKSALFLFNEYRERGYKSWLAVGSKFSNDPDIFEIPKPSRNLIPNNKIVFSFERLLKEVDSQVLNKTGINFHLNALTSSPLEIQRKIQRQLGWEDFNFPSTKHILDMVPELPNIVHLHNLHGNYFDLRYLPELSHQIPTILNLRDMWTLTGHCAYPIDCTRWQIGCDHCPDLNIYPAIVRDATKYNFQKKKNIYTRSKLYITTPSKWLMDQVMTSQMFSSVEYRVIGNAINVHIFRPGNKKLARQKLHIPENAQIVLFLAHSEFKDIKTMRATLSQLKKWKVPLIFICVGINGEKESLGEGELIFAGRILDENKMILYYQAADVYLHAAHHEVFGKSLVEAMACATPVVATGVDGIPEVVNDGVTGFLTEAKDSITLAERIKTLLENPNKMVEIGLNATNYAKREFNLDRQADSFLSWYNEILSINAKREPGIH